MTVPAGRGRWRFLLTDKTGVDVAELGDARSRRLTFDLVKPAQATFSMPGLSAQLAGLVELETDLKAFRFDDDAGDQLLFRGRVGTTQDTITETTHTVNLTALDYRAMLARRIVPYWIYWDQVDQLRIAEDLVNHANTLNFYWPPPPFGANGSLGLSPFGGRLNPDGTPLGGTTMLRDRDYQGGQNIQAVLDDLSTCENGFDYEIGADLQARFWYPYRGANITAWAAEYGSTVANLSRTVNPSAYANWVYVTGYTPDPALPPISSTVYQTGLDDPGEHPEGVWQTFSAYPDISVQATLDEQAAGLLALDALLEPTYTLTLVQGRWHPGDCWLGDFLPIVVRSGRLDVNTVQRVQTVTIAIDDNGGETVTLTAGRPPASWTDSTSTTDRRLDRLERR